MTYKWTLLPVLALSFEWTTSAQAQEKKEEFKETYEAFAVAMGTSNPPVIPSGMTATLQINITRWTTDEERERLFAVLVEKGQKDLLNAIQKEKETGFVRVTGRAAARNPFPSERLRYARQLDLGEGKRRIVLATDRYISFYEARNQPRTRDYDMTILVMDVDAEGNGEGQLAMGVRLKVDDEKKTLVVEKLRHRAGAAHEDHEKELRIAGPRAEWAEPGLDPGSDRDSARGETIHPLKASDFETPDSEVFGLAPGGAT